MRGTRICRDFIGSRGVHHGLHLLQRHGRGLVAPTAPLVVADGLDGFGREVVDGPPPFLGTWKRIHTVVIIYLFALITLFYFFGKSYA